MPDQLRESQIRNSSRSRLDVANTPARPRFVTRPDEQWVVAIVAAAAWPDTMAALLGKLAPISDPSD